MVTYKYTHTHTHTLRLYEGSISACDEVLERLSTLPAVMAAARVGRIEQPRGDGRRVCLLLVLGMRRV